MRKEKPDRQALAERLHSASIHLLRRLRKVDEATGLTAPKLSALSVLVFGGSRTLGELAAAEQVRPPSMTRIVQELEAAGLVRRRVDTRDRRVAHIEATARAKRVLNQGRSRRAALLAEWLGDLSDHDVRALASGVAVLERITVRRVEPPS